MQTKLLNNKQEWNELRIRLSSLSSRGEIKISEVRKFPCIIIYKYNSIFHDMDGYREGYYDICSISKSDILELIK